MSESLGQTVSAKKVKKETKKRRPITWKLIVQQKYLLIMSVPFVIWLFIFRYIPLSGWMMAFEDYRIKDGIIGSLFKKGTDEWQGFTFAHFERLFNDKFFYDALQNTLAMSLLGLVFNTCFAIVFAILLNEIRSVAFKKTVQTISYLPHFVSWVVISGMVTSLLNYNGTINDLLINLNIIDSRVQWLQNEDYFYWIVVLSDLWKETGWNAIIYLAAIIGIDSTLYEAAKVDGANRWKRIWHITLPGIKSTIIVLLIMGIGGVLNIGFEKQFLLSNATVENKALVLDSYALKFISQYSFGTSIGIFKSVVGVTLMLIANQVAKKAGEGSVV